MSPMNDAKSPEERVALSRSARERDPRRQQRRSELNALRTGETMMTDFIEDRHMPTDRVDDRILASGPNNSDRAVDSSHIKRSAVDNDHINSMDGGKLHNGTVTSGKIDDMDGSKLRLASVGDNRLEENYAFSSHSHSQYLTEGEGDNRYGTAQHPHSFTYFMKYRRDERERMLEKRAALREAQPLDYEFSERNFNRLIDQVEILKENLEIALKLHQDYRNFDAFERERRFKDPEWAKWTDAYKRVYQVDEYFEQPRRLEGLYGQVRKDHHDAIHFIEDDEHEAHEHEVHE